jgi:hypothetical protein
MGIDFVLQCPINQLRQRQWLKQNPKRIGTLREPQVFKLAAHMVGKTGAQPQQTRVIINFFI